MTLPQDVTRMQSEMRAAVREHWQAFLIEGILLVVLGLAAMIVPPLASLAVTIFLGWMFLISGVAGLVLTFWARQMPGFWWSLISAILAVGAGIVLLAQPVQGTLTLTIVVGAYFLAEAVPTLPRAASGLRHRRRAADQGQHRHRRHQVSHLASPWPGKTTLARTVRNFDGCAVTAALCRTVLRLAHVGHGAEQPDPRRHQH